jgi:hypothetical protein
LNSLEQKALSYITDQLNIKADIISGNYTLKSLIEGLSKIKSVPAIIHDTAIGPMFNYGSCAMNKYGVDSIQEYWSEIDDKIKERGLFLFYIVYWNQGAFYVIKEKYEKYGVQFIC